MTASPRDTARLEDNLVLVGYLTHLLGNDANDLRAAMKNAVEGLRPDGQSNFYGVLESRASCLQAPLTLDIVKGLDSTIMGIEAELSAKRQFRLKYFQYLAALYTELYLHLLQSDRAGLLLALESHRTEHYAHLPEITPAELSKLALWMATGSGKTLMMHLNLLQFTRRKLFEPNNIILVTPSDTLSKQHLESLRASGIPSHYFSDPAPLDTVAVKVIEITKLLPAGGARSGGVSVPVSDFGGPNLVLVDEGHKGTQSKTDRDVERKWRTIREALAADGGFTLEYSATFAQVTETNEELFREYARTIVFDYPYGRFHGDGYGKDFAIINLKQEDDLFGDTLLLGALLSFYEQHRYVAAHPEVASEYGLETPLMVFIGAYVNAGPEVLQVVQFLNRVLEDRTWAEAGLTAILEGRSGLPGVDGQDAFATAYPYLRSETERANLYNSLTQELFHGQGHLHLHSLKKADGEIGLRAASSDRYFGLVYVGDTRAFLNKVEDETGLTIGEDDHLRDPLFPTINQSGSSLNILIGSRKFTEGWSSWRVSAMGLIKVGNNAGAQVLQLFGRGVRLRGMAMGLRRSEFLPGQHPEHLALAETLSIFGLSANYLKRFLDMLRREGIEPTVERVLEIKIDGTLLAADLQGLELDSDYSFMDETRTFAPGGRVSVSVLPALEIGSMAVTRSAMATADEQRLSNRALSLLPFEELYQHALRHKVKKGWRNLFISRQGVQTFFERHAWLAAPQSILEPSDPESLSRLVTACEALVEKGLDAYYIAEQRRKESEHLRLVTITSEHGNFPRVKDQPAYMLKMPKDLLEQVEALIADGGELQKEATTDLLPRLYVEQHLYKPLLVGADKVKSTPTGLEPSEVAFIRHLRQFWNGAHAQLEWSKHEVYLLRNLPKKGIGFFQTAGFYPDFLLWLKCGDKQALSFIDPKGLVRWPEEKVRLLSWIDKQSPINGLPVSAFIATPTALEDIQVQDKETEGEKRAYLESRHVYLQDDGVGYVKRIMERMKAQLGDVTSMPLYL